MRRSALIIITMFMLFVAIQVSYAAIPGIFFRTSVASLSTITGMSENDAAIVVNGATFTVYYYNGSAWTKSYLYTSNVSDTEYGYLDNVTSSIQDQIDAKGTLTNVVEDVTPQLGGDLDLNGNGIDNVSQTEFSYLDGVTSSIQTQLNAKGTLSNVVEDTTPQLGGTLDLNGNAIDNVSQTEFSYLDGVTSAIQTQLGGKSDITHDHSGVYQPADTNLDNVVAKNAWKLLYKDENGYIQEYAFQADGTYLKFTGPTSALDADTPAGGSGTISGPESADNNALAAWVDNTTLKTTPCTVNFTDNSLLCPGGFVSTPVSGTSGYSTYYEDPDNGGEYIKIQAPSSLADNVTWTLPDADSSGTQYLRSNGSGTLSWGTPAGSGDVESVGDCADGACYDGSSDGGTYIRLYDGDSNYTQISPGNSSSNLTFTFPTAVAGGDNYLLNFDADGTGGFTDPASFATAGHNHDGTYQPDDSDLDSLATGITGIVLGGGNGSGYSAATAGTDYVSPSSSETLTNKTLDTAGTGNVFTHYLQKDYTITNPVAADSSFLFKAQFAMTITDIHCISEGSTPSITLQILECGSDGTSCAGVDGATTITCDSDGAEDDGSLSNGSIDAGDWVSVVYGAPSGTVTALSYSIYYSEAQ